jgi:hypothetical protein
MNCEIKNHTMTHISQIPDLLEVEFSSAWSQALHFLPASMRPPHGAALELPFHSKSFEQASSYRIAPMINDTGGVKSLRQDS